MMNPPEECRHFALEQRREAEAARLPLVKLKHLQAAERWEVLAEEAERVRRTAV